MVPCASLALVPVEGLLSRLRTEDAHLKLLFYLISLQRQPPTLNGQAPSFVISQTGTIGTHEGHALQDKAFLVVIRPARLRLYDSADVAIHPPTMRLPPYSVLASWPEPNYVDPETRGSANEIIALGLLILVTLMLGIRLYTRTVISHGFGPDDTLICLAYLPATAFAITNIVADHALGWNRHVWDVRLKYLTDGIKLSLASQSLFDVATSLTKLSMLAMLYRLACASKSRMRFVVLGMMIFVTLSGILFVPILIFQCKPISDYWTLSFQEQDCINESAYVTSAGIINTVVDLIVVLLPIHTVLSLQLAPRQRIIVIALFGAGFIATAAGVARTVLTWRMYNTDNFDVTWHAWSVWFASSIELFLGILCASIPATKPFFSQYLPQILGNIPSKVGRSRKGSKAVTDLESDASAACSVKRESRYISLNPPPIALARDFSSINTSGKPIAMVDVGEKSSPTASSMPETMPPSTGVSIASDWSPLGDSPTPLSPPNTHGR
ncbi:hypothetical protein MKZ38_008077 [Zalerion maritima]|uniref:Rhodopsin domain-containing protein n=1 Tax=Zalerion maritima TaxID=339359 RepID=A0AAD5RHU8_9PEZI|nr:hypothetical protein MKZ38_008077 [Zalerion maritima]